MTPRSVSTDFLNTQTKGSGLLSATALFSIVTFYYLYSNLGFVLMEHYSLPFRPSYFYIIILGFAGFLFFVSNNALAALAQHKTLVTVLLCFIFLIAAHSLFAPLGTEGRQILITNIEYALIMMSALVFFTLTHRLSFVIFSLRLLLGASIFFNLLDYVRPELMDFGYDLVRGRASGLYFNANVSATFLCMLIPITCFFLPRLQRYFWYAAAFCGVLVTFSRGGTITLLVAISLTEFFKHQEDARRRFAGAASATAQLVVAAVLLALMSSSLIGFLITELAPYLEENTRARLMFSVTTDDRYYLIMRGLEAFYNAPLFGHGVGYTREWIYGGSTHNMFVLLLAEQGILGGLWMLAFLAVVGAYGGPFGLITLIMFSVSAMFSHNHFEWPAMAVLFALYFVVQARYNAGVKLGSRASAASFHGAANPLNVPIGHGGA